MQNYLTACHESQVVPSPAMFAAVSDIRTRDAVELENMPLSTDVLLCLQVRA